MLYPLRSLIRRFDTWLSHRYGVYVFQDREGILLRIQEARLWRDLSLPDGFVARGSRALLLHLWNERMPPIPPAGPDLVYAVRLRRALLFSLRELARYWARTPRLRDVEAVGGVTAHFVSKGEGNTMLLEHLGFTVLPYHRPAGAFGEFWENFYTWWLMWAFNPVSMRHRPIWALQRLEFWMTGKAFLERYGGVIVSLLVNPFCW